MALETRHVERQMLFNLLKALHRDPELGKSREFNDIIYSLKAVMEAEDVALVNEQIQELIRLS